MLPNRRNLGIVHLGIHRISILQLIPIGMVHEPRTVRHIMHEQTPKEVPCDDGLGVFLRGFDDRVELREGRGRVVAGPVVFACEVDAVGGAY